MELFRTRPIKTAPSELKPTLNAFDLVLLGIGVIMGVGIFVLSGIAAATHTGPAIFISYLIAGLACFFTALSYAELASAIGGAGSAYSYSYASLGELIAWIIGWDLILEYGLATCTVASGWSGYINNFLTTIGIKIPQYLLTTPMEGGVINLPAMLITCFLGFIIALGIEQSVRFNALMVFIKMTALVIFILVAVRYIDTKNWEPFLPFGWSGVFSGAALVFFAFVGFDAVSTAAEETINPERNLPIGIIAPLIICCFFYVVVSGLLVSIASYKTLNVSYPLADAIINLKRPLAASIISLGAIASLTSVMLIFIFALTRVFFAISRDGLLPNYFAKVDPKTKTPIRIIILTTILMSLIAGFFSITTIAELVNLGSLASFIIVCIGVIVLRYSKPDLPRSFKTPFSPLFPMLGVISSAYLMIYIPWVTWLRFIIWMIIGLIIYFSFSYRNSNIVQT